MLCEDSDLCSQDGSLDLAGAGIRADTGGLCVRFGDVCRQAVALDRVWGEGVVGDVAAKSVDAHLLVVAGPVLGGAERERSYAQNGLHAVGMVGLFLVELLLIKGALWRASWRGWRENQALALLEGMDQLISGQKVVWLGLLPQLLQLLVVHPVVDDVVDRRQRGVHGIEHLGEPRGPPNHGVDVGCLLLLL